MSFPSTDNFERSRVTKQYIHMYTHKHKYTPSTQIKMKVTPFFMTTLPILPTTLFLWEEKSNPLFFHISRTQPPFPSQGRGGSK